MSRNVLNALVQAVDSGPTDDAIFLPLLDKLEAVMERVVDKDD